MPTIVLHKIMRFKSTSAPLHKQSMVDMLGSGLMSIHGQVGFLIVLSMLKVEKSHCQNGTDQEKRVEPAVKELELHLPAQRISDDSPAQLSFKIIHMVG